MANNFAADYIDVATRIAEFRAKHPDGSLQPADPASPYKIETIGDKTFIVYQAAAYRTADDPRPGIGLAWEQFPGRTPYTRDSELMNAETSAWGRAIMAALAADSKKGISTAEEVRNRQAERETNGQPATQQVPRQQPPSQQRAAANDLARKAAAGVTHILTAATEEQANNMLDVAEKSEASGTNVSGLLSATERETLGLGEGQEVTLAELAAHVCTYVAKHKAAVRHETQAAAA